jgi:hypothetical protein
MQTSLFYSKACKHCKRILEEYETKDIQLVCIDTDSFPAYITTVPTIVDDQSKQMYVGTSAFKWLDEKKSVKPYEYGGSSTNNGFSFIQDNNSYYAEPLNFTDIDHVSTTNNNNNQQVDALPENRSRDDGSGKSMESLINQRAKDLQELIK